MAFTAGKLKNPIFMAVKLVNLVKNWSYQWKLEKVSKKVKLGKTVKVSKKLKFGKKVIKLKVGKNVKVDKNSKSR